MKHCLAFVFAMFFAFVSVSSTVSVAAPSEWVSFTLERDRSSGDSIQARFQDGERGRSGSNWSSGFRPSELIGLDHAGFRSAGGRTLGFAVTREAGRLDCSGSGGSSRAAGHCRFTPDAGFTQLLGARGIGRPTRDQAFALMAINARRALIDGLAAARYPTPSLDELVALTALGADGRYIAELARTSFRPADIDSLIAFKALGITPDFVLGFQRIGYRNLPADRLIELKALGITPEFVRAQVPHGQALPPVNRLVELKLFGRLR